MSNQVSIGSILKNHEIRLRNIEENFKQLNEMNDKIKEKISNNNDNDTNKNINLSMINDKFELLSLTLKENKEYIDNTINSLLEKYNRMNELFSIQYLEIIKFKEKFIEKNRIFLDIKEKDIINEATEANDSAGIDLR
jgi:ABC-type transporter Mla subunit MlaD